MVRILNDRAKCIGRLADVVRLIFVECHCCHIDAPCSHVRCECCCKGLAQPSISILNEVKAMVRSGDHSSQNQSLCVLLNVLSNQRTFVGQLQTQIDIRCNLWIDLDFSSDVVQIFLELGCSAEPTINPPTTIDANIAIQGHVDACVKLQMAQHDEARIGVARVQRWFTATNDRVFLFGQFSFSVWPSVANRRPDFSQSTRLRSPLRLAVKFLN